MLTGQSPGNYSLAVSAQPTAVVATTDLLKAPDLLDLVSKISNPNYIPPEGSQESVILPSIFDNTQGYFSLIYSEPSLNSDSPTAGYDVDSEPLRPESGDHSPYTSSRSIPSSTLLDFARKLPSLNASSNTTRTNTASEAMRATSSASRNLARREIAHRQEYLAQARSQQSASTWLASLRGCGEVLEPMKGRGQLHCSMRELTPFPKLPTHVAIAPGQRSGTRGPLPENLGVTAIPLEEYLTTGPRLNAEGRCDVFIGGDVRSQATSRVGTQRMSESRCSHRPFDAEPVPTLPVAPFTHTLTRRGRAIVLTVHNTTTAPLPMRVRPLASTPYYTCVQHVAVAPPAGTAAFTFSLPPSSGPPLSPALPSALLESWTLEVADTAHAAHANAADTHAAPHTAPLTVVLSHADVDTYVRVDAPCLAPLPLPAPDAAEATLLPLPGVPKLPAGANTHAACTSTSIPTARTSPPAAASHLSSLPFALTRNGAMLPLPLLLRYLSLLAHVLALAPHTHAPALPSPSFSSLSSFLAHLPPHRRARPFLARFLALLARAHDPAATPTPLSSLAHVALTLLLADVSRSIPRLRAAVELALPLPPLPPRTAVPRPKPAELAAIVASRLTVTRTRTLALRALVQPRVSAAMHALHRAVATHSLHALVFSYLARTALARAAARRTALLDATVLPPPPAPQPSVAARARARAQPLLPYQRACAAAAKGDVSATEGIVCFSQGPTHAVAHTTDGSYVAWPVSMPVAEEPLRARARSRQREGKDSRPATPAPGPAYGQPVLLPLLSGVAAKQVLCTAHNLTWILTEQGQVYRWPPPAPLPPAFAPLAALMHAKLPTSLRSPLLASLPPAARTLAHLPSLAPALRLLAPPRVRALARALHSAAAAAEAIPTPTSPSHTSAGSVSVPSSPPALASRGAHAHPPIPSRAIAPGALAALMPRVHAAAQYDNTLAEAVAGLLAETCSPLSPLTHPQLALFANLQPHAAAPNPIAPATHLQPPPLSAPSLSASSTSTSTAAAAAASSLATALPSSPSPIVSAWAQAALFLANALLAQTSAYAHGQGFSASASASAGANAGAGAISGGAAGATANAGVGVSGAGAGTGAVSGPGSGNVAAPANNIPISLPPSLFSPHTTHDHATYVAPEPLLRPLPALFPHPIVSLAAPSDPALSAHALFLLDSEGVVWACGTAHAAKAHLLPSLTPQPLPQPLHCFSARGLKVRRLVCGHKHVAALTTCGHVYVWGHSDSGGLGSSDPKPRSTPTLVAAVARQGCCAPQELTEITTDSAVAQTCGTNGTGTGIGMGMGVGVGVGGMPLVPPALSLAVAALAAHAHTASETAHSGTSATIPTAAATSSTPVADGDAAPAGACVCVCGVQEVECVGAHTLVLTREGQCLSTEQGSGFTAKKPGVSM